MFRFQGRFSYRVPVNDLPFPKPETSHTLNTLPIHRKYHQNLNTLNLKPNYLYRSPDSLLTRVATPLAPAAGTNLEAGLQLLMPFIGHAFKTFLPRLLRVTSSGSCQHNTTSCCNPCGMSGPSCPCTQAEAQRSYFHWFARSLILGFAASCLPQL